jgi:hypothetical protein
MRNDRFKNFNRQRDIALVWRKSDGTAGEIDGIPKSWEALIAEVQGAHNVSAR